MTDSTNEAASTGVVSNVTKIMVAKLATLLLALAMQVVLARALGPAGRGVYEAAILWGSLAILVFNPGVETAALYYVSSGRVKLAHGISASLAISIAALAFALGATALLLSWAPRVLEGIISKARPVDFFMGTIAAATTLFAQISFSMSTAQQKFGLYSSAQIAHRIAVLSFSALILLGLHSGALGALLSIALADVLLIASVIYWLSRGSHSVLVAPGNSTIYRLAKYGIRFYMGKFGNQMNFRLGPLVLAALATPTELGLYGLASAIAIQYMALPDAVYTVLLPQLAANPESAARQTARAGRIFVAFGAIALIVSATVARPLFALLFSDSFLQSVPLFQIIMAAFVVRAVGKVYEPYLIAHNHPGKISMAIASGLAINALLLVGLYGELGLKGAAWSLVGNYSVSTALLIAYFVRVSFTRPVDCMMPTRRDATDLRDLFSTFRRSRT